AGLVVVAVGDGRALARAARDSRVALLAVFNQTVAADGGAVRVGGAVGARRTAAILRGSRRCGDVLAMLGASRPSMLLALRRGTIGRGRAVTRLADRNAGVTEFAVSGIDDAVAAA